MPEQNGCGSGADVTPAPPFLEHLYLLREVADLLRISETQARRLFEEEPGVLNFGTSSQKCLRIPESVFQRVYENRANGGDPLAELKARRRRVK